MPHRRTRVKILPLRSFALQMRYNVPGISKPTNRRTANMSTNMSRLVATPQTHGLHKDARSSQLMYPQPDQPPKHLQLHTHTRGTLRFIHRTSHDRQCERCCARRARRFIALTVIWSPAMMVRLLESSSGGRGSMASANSTRRTGRTGPRNFEAVETGSRGSTTHTLPNRVCYGPKYTQPKDKRGVLLVASLVLLTWLLLILSRL